jgi:single-strand DNA-binding protein
MNKVFLIGNITKDVEVKTTATGKKVASLSLAVSDGKDANGQDLTQYFNLKIWDKLAEIVEKYCQKGHKLAVSGKFVTRKWDKPDGTVAYISEVVVNDIELLTSRAEAERLSNRAPQPAQIEYESKAPKPAPAKNNANELPSIDINDLDINAQIPF